MPALELPTTGRIETSAGALTFELYADAAPRSVANFIRYASNGLYDGGSFYRATDRQATSHGACCITIVQGGRLGQEMTGSLSDIQQAVADSPLPPVPHEPTSETGLFNIQGALAFGRTRPGTATSEFFISLEDNPLLDVGGAGHPDGLGYAVFGRITSGLALLRVLIRRPRLSKDGPFADQLLAEPLQITHIAVDGVDRE
ncbi:MAG: peptidylprolyl isomerase [Pseudomonadota bacterium]